MLDLSFLFSFWVRILYHFKAEMWRYLLLIDVLNSHLLDHQLNQESLIVYGPLPSLCQSLFSIANTKKVVSYSQAFLFTSACHVGDL